MSDDATQIIHLRLKLITHIPFHTKFLTTLSFLIILIELTAIHSFRFKVNACKYYWKLCCRPLLEDREILWEKRHYLVSQPQALPKVLLAAHSWDYACLSDLHSLLHAWNPLDAVSSLQLLLPWLDSQTGFNIVMLISLLDFTLKIQATFC